ncbi:hypothetical protein Tco_0722528 [Tanacetum coccineum]
MSTLAEFMIVAGADNRPPMLDKPQYESWKSRMKLYIQGKDHGRIILNLVENGPLVWPTVEQEDGNVRLKTYEELSDKEKLQADCDLKATNIVLQGLPPDVYALVNHHKIAKDIWDRVKLLMQGTSLSRQERECKLYDEFDKLSHVKGETLYQYYLWFAQLINDMNIIQMTMQPVQVNTKFLNSLPQEWDSGLAVPTFLPGDDPIACMNKEMAFLSAVFSPRFPSTNNQLRSSSNLRDQATVQDGRVTVQQVQGRQGEWHMARQYTQPKRRRDATWFKEKVLLGQAHAEGKELDEEQLAFLADPGVADGQVAQTITHNDHLDAYDPDCDDISSAKAVLMANLSSCDLDVLFEVPYSDTSQNDMMNQSVQELQYYELSPIVDYLDNEITSDSNIILYSQYLQETQHAIVQNTNTYAHQNFMIISMFEQMSNHATNWDKANNERNVEMEPDIKNMPMSEYLEYEAAKERRLWDDVRSRRSPTHYDEADFSSSLRNKSNTFYYPYSHDILPSPVQSYPRNDLVSTEDSDRVKIMDDLFRIGDENLKRMEQDIDQDSICEQDDDLEDDREEDDDDGDIFYMWDITVEDVEQIRKCLTPNVPDVPY